MTVSHLYNFSYIAPGETTGLFIHSYSDREAVNYSIVIYNVDVPSLDVEVRAMISQGETFRWGVDGTTARKIYVTNLEPSSSIEASVLEMYESF